MALTQLQLPSKEPFYRNIQGAANTIREMMYQWEKMAEFINFLDVSDLDAMGVDTGQVRTDLVNFKTLLNELIAFWNNGAVTPTNNPKTVVNKLRTM